MFLPITNEPRNYEWGSLTAISGLLGRQASGSPEAELWLGDHPGSPAQILDQDLANGATTLDHWIAADPVTALGTDSGEARLGFLLKILAADAPLSLQAHPTREQAVTGFARENAAGIPLDAAHRNYKDVQHKPEVIYALSETFEALASPSGAVRRCICRPATSMPTCKGSQLK
ncbi:type I phosphomannose isomerase catalytic subunit [Arthrobacter sp. ES1]|uniref:type I phosphomannose isomerase catalytic subunit n=1 Tax=unclassified Arthrobacter TaxID=235627 RepID=UPI0028681BA1|nr:type I phosphomannose isomerase catalytic subunit [Arthrobacter sp. ES1]MCB5280770.1 Mannose-6-phosphate isomerase [Arthrobacter sp. ES1]